MDSRLKSRVPLIMPGSRIETDRMWPAFARAYSLSGRNRCNIPAHLSALAPKLGGQRSAPMSNSVARGGRGQVEVDCEARAEASCVGSIGFIPRLAYVLFVIMDFAMEHFPTALTALFPPKILLFLGEDNRQSPRSARKGRGSVRYFQPDRGSRPECWPRKIFPVILHCPSHPPCTKLLEDLHPVPRILKPRVFLRISVALKD